MKSSESEAENKNQRPRGSIDDKKIEVFHSTQASELLRFTSSTPDR